VLVFTLVVTHITIAAVTIFLHRAQAHRALELHPIPSHFFRFWLWLTTGMVTKEWVAIHRKHHAKCETVDDPHSPHARHQDRAADRQRALPRRSQGAGDAGQVRPQHAGRLDRAQPVHAATAGRAWA
jgi:stearoyl-CoA desaturase (delta-9 desaturase)